MLAAATAIVSCSGKSAETVGIDQPEITKRLPGDRTVYGLACEGCTDSVIVLLPEDDSDPIRFNCIRATRNHKVQGRMKVGDWIAVVPSEKDSLVADLAIDLEELKGIWCYVVMPKLRDASTMTKRQQAQVIREMPDSVKETYMVPREYGFYLKRQWVCQSVGYVSQSNALEDESPVVYPRLSFFTGWRIWNGKLITISGQPELKKDKNGQNTLKIRNERQDTCDIDYLLGDSLVLSSDGASRSYYRKKSLDEVNVKAKAIAAKLSEKAKAEAAQ